MGGDKRHKGSEQQAAKESGNGIEDATAEDDAESGHSKGSAENRLPPRLAFGGADGLQAAFQLIERHGMVAQVARDLVHLNHTAQLHTLEGDVFGAGEVLAGRNDAIAEYKKMLVFNAVNIGNMLHGVFYSADFGSVFEQDVSCFGG